MVEYFRFKEILEEVKEKIENGNTTDALTLIDENIEELQKNISELDNYMDKESERLIKEEAKKMGITIVKPNSNYNGKDNE